MVKTRFIMRMALLAIFSISTFGVSYAQLSDLKRTINENKDKKYLQFNLNGPGIHLWANGLDATITNADGETKTLKEAMEPDCSFPLKFPLVVNNDYVSTTVHIIVNKNQMTKEQMAELYVSGVLHNRVEGKYSGHFNVNFRADDNNYPYASCISLSTYYKNDNYGTTYNNIALADLRFLNAYAVIETSQPADRPLIVDSVATMNTFDIELADPQALLTKVQMDSVSDGFDYITAAFDELGKRLAAEGDTIDADQLVNETAFLYRDLFERYPRTYLATHMSVIREREARYNRPSVMHQGQVDPKREEELRKLTDMSDFHPNTKKIGNVTVTTNYKTGTSAHDTNVPVMQMNRNGQIRTTDPLKRTQTSTGKVTFKW